MLSNSTSLASTGAYPSSVLFQVGLSALAATDTGQMAIDTAKGKVMDHVAEPVIDKAR